MELTSQGVCLSVYQCGEERGTRSQEIGSGYKQMLDDKIW